jgi:HK97 family phage major capsid protein
VHVRQTRDELIARSRALQAQINALHDEYPGKKFPQPAKDQFNAATGELQDIHSTLTEMRQRDRILAEAAEDQALHEPTMPGATATGRYALGEWLMRGITGASGAGASFTPSEFPSMFFDRLAAASVGLTSGFQVITTVRDSVVIPRWTADTTAAWVAEAATITSTDANADTVTATPRKLAGLQQITNEVWADSNPAIFEVIAAGLVRACALKADLGFFEGTGTPPEIRGLKNVAGIGTVSLGTNGATPTNFDPFADALGTLETANTEGGAIVMHPRTWQTLTKIKEVAGSAKPVLQDNAGSVSQGMQRSIYGVPVYLTSQLSITETQGTAPNASSAYVYTPAQVVVVQRADVSVELDSSRLFNSDQSEIRAITRLDLVVPNPAAVVRILGILP